MMKLYETEGNPIPGEPVCGAVVTPDRVNLRYARWKAQNHPVKGTVLLLHGRTEFIEKLFETISYLLGDGFDVITFDWRGQGGSDRLLGNRHKGHVDSFDQYVIDLDTILEQVALPDCPAPYYIFGHSTGATVALMAAPALANRIRRMVLCTPLLGLRGLWVSQKTVKLMAGTLVALGLGGMFVAGGRSPDETRPFKGNKVTSDTKRYARNATIASQHGELAIGGPTAAWLFAAIQAMDQIMDPDFHGQITVPILFVQAGSDQVVSNLEIERLAGQLRSGSTISIAGSMHEIMQERDIFRQQLLAAFSAFVPGTEYVGSGEN